jgi:PAS domain-containing protein
MARGLGIRRLELGVSSHRTACSDDVHALVDETLIAEAIGNCGCGVLLAEDRGPVVAANDAICLVLGYRRRELVGTALTDLVPALPSRTRGDALAGLGRSLTWKRADGRSIECATWLLATTIARTPFELVLVAPIT